MIHDPMSNLIHIFKRCRMFEFWCETISKVNDRKTSFCKTHAIILISFLISINPTSTMETNNNRKFFFFFFRNIEIHCIPFWIITIKNIIKSLNCIRCSQTFISDIVPFFELFSNCISKYRQILTPSFPHSNIFLTG